jgi:hypothetical protein
MMATDKSKKQETDVTDYIKEWDTGKAWIDNYTRDFPDLDNLADAVALSNTKNAPMVGSVTLASAIRQIPRASIQQLPSFSVEVNGTKLSIPALVCEFLVRKMVFNQDTFGKGVLSTMQIGAESALTHGFQADIASIGNVMNDFGASMKLIHYNDVVIEPGVFDANESAYFHVRTRVTKSQLKRILKAAKSNPETTWDTSALEELIATDPNSDTLSRYLSQPRDNSGFTQNANTYDVITRYATGAYGDIVTYSLNMTKPLRKMKSRSKFGYPRVNFLVIDPAQLTPFGVSRVRLASPTANYGNIYLQSTAKMLLMNSDPPVFQRGTFTTPIRLKRGALWKSIDPNAEVKLQELSNSTLSQFQSVLDFVDNQIYAMMGVTRNSVPGSQGGGGAYQNSTATKMQQQTRDLATTQITNIVENHIRQYALTALDLFISEQVGESPLIVDDKCKDAINDIFPDTIGDDNVIKINWEDFYNNIHTWTIDIDLSMSPDQLDDKKRGDLQDQLTVMSQTSDPNDPVAAARKRALEDELLEKTAPDVAKSTEQIQEQPQPAQPQQLPPQ